MKLLFLLVCLSIPLDHCYTSSQCLRTCHEYAKCEIRDGTQGCFCMIGYTGDGITFCDDDNECQNATQICGENANCTNTIGSYYCMCAPGFRSTGQDKFEANDGTFCQEIDECNEPDTVDCGDHAKCENTVGGFNCSCKEGYLPSTGKLQFKPNDGTVCQDGHHLCSAALRKPSYSPRSQNALDDTICSKCHLDDNCLSESINKTIKEVKNIKDPLALLQEIRKSTTGELLPVDVISYVEALAVSYPLLIVPDKETLTNTTINAFVNTVNNFVEKEKITVWNELSEDNRRKSITKLMHTVEQATLNLAKNFKKMTQLDINASDLALKVFAFDSQHMKHIHPHAHMEEDYIKIFPRKTEATVFNGSIAIVFLRYDSIGPLLASFKNSQDEAMSKPDSQQSVSVNSPVIAAAITSNPPVFYQFEKITFTLKHVKSTEQDSTRCAFWNYSPDTMNGNWSTEGCERTYSNITHTSCTCNHLTHFAILMSSGLSVSITHYSILTRITQLGIIISLICLSMCIFTFLFFSEIQSTRITIHKNLCCSLFLAELLFLIGINMYNNKLFCSVIAGLLHYFFLAAFAWMCIEGIHLYLIVVGVIYNKGFLHKNFYIFGYCSPAVVVGISAVLGYRYYGTDKVCWLSTENNFIWSFIGPACLIILVNLIAFVVIIYKVFRHTAMLKPEVNCYENVRSCARGALALLFLLGATWIFGVLHVVHGSVVTAYLFTIVNAFQGMFIFIFLCVLSRKIQEEYYRLFKNVPCCFGCLR
ncbi:adhesion G protein-coupled receptor L4 [Microcaecilia unicolor]|uniref:Adhesion G protein-coupled receptor L4 n=1 Tax=Microcaecilia unicolor TaxID=1415580 RepID=A0A6P7Y5I3_9AMPH|nr:adhesion G protein-coupled receptor L4 [Microcaecilia unicolor]